MDPATLAAIYAVLGTLGLVVTDTYVNSNTMYLNTTVAEAVAEEGFEPSVVDGIFIAKVKKITKIPSLVSVPAFQPGSAKSVSAALAEFANLQDALTAMQALLRMVPPKLVTSVVVADQYQRVRVVENAPDGRAAEYVVGDEMKVKLVLTGYDPHSGYFDLTVEGHTEDDDLEHLIRDAAFRAVLQLDPYIALLFEIDRLGTGERVVADLRTLLDEQIARQPDTVINPDRALLENMHGILSLLENKHDEAHEDFREAIASDPNQPIGYLNLAFLEVHLDRYDDAIALVEKVIYPSYWPMTGNAVLLSTGHIIKAVAETEKGDYRAAEASFRRAVALNPRSSEAYVYWARLLRKTARPAEAERMIYRARQNSAYFENYPESALLYFWLTEEGVDPLVRRTRLVETK